MRKLTFKEYWESKEALLQASNNLPKIITEYIVKKYCKLPIQLDEAERDYISLKPHDTFKILWEFHADNSVHVQCFIMDEVNYTPCWQDEKIKKWVDTTLEEVE